MSNPTVPPVSDPSDDQNAPDQPPTTPAGGGSPAEPEIEMDSLETGAE
jgi:hypothetical protein